MKQLFLGIAVGIWVSIISIFLLKDTFLAHYNWELVNEYDNKPEQVVTVESPDLKAEFIIPEEHTVAVDYIDNNLKEVSSDEEKMESFKQNTPFKFWAILYSIKNKDRELWNMYWTELYNSVENNPFDRDIYFSKIDEAFDKILEDSLAVDEYKDYLLDGAVYLSNHSLEEKEEICENAFHEAWADVPDDGVEYCTSLSYVFEAIRKDDASYCSKISYIPEDTALLKNCEALFAN